MASLATFRCGRTLPFTPITYTPERVETACARALGFDLIDVRRRERILVLALEHEGQLAPPSEPRVQPLPAGRFARSRIRSPLRRVPTGERALSATIDPDLIRLLKRLMLGPLLPTLPERLTLARAQHLDYTAFLTLLLADEVQRRDPASARTPPAASRIRGPRDIGRIQLDLTGPTRSTPAPARVHTGVPGTQGALHLRRTRRRRKEATGSVPGVDSCACWSFRRVHSRRCAARRVEPSARRPQVRQGLSSLPGARSCHPRKFRS
jgi:hypothetical protein